MTHIVVGRFQVPELHAGHLHLLKSANDGADKLVVVLGISKQVDGRNPYSVPHRIKIIHNHYPHIDIRGIEDQPGDDDTWSRNLDYIASSYEEPVFYVGRDSFKSHYKGKHKVIEIESLPGYSGTEMRAKLKK